MKIPESKHAAPTPACGCDHCHVLDDIHHDHDHHGHDHAHDHGHDGHDILSRWLIPRLIVGIVLFIVAIVMRADHPSTALALYIASYLIAGYGTIIRAVINLFHGHIFTEYFLMTVATVGAFVIGEYIEACAVMLLSLIGEQLEHRAVDRTRRSIASLAEMRPDEAHREVDGEVMHVAPSEVHPGDTIIVYPGERVPLDGTLMSDAAALNFAALTGESMPVTVEPGCEIAAGAINGSSVLTLRVVRDEQHSAVMRILNMAEAAGRRKSRIEVFTSRFAGIYTPIVVILALIIALAPPLLFHQAWNDWVYRALNFLVISCPCALVISVPLALIAGTGRASRHGIFIRGSQFLEGLADVQSVVFDKTGTLSTGTFGVTDIRPADGIDADRLLELAAAAEQHSTHPIAEAIRDAHTGPLTSELSDIEEIAGHGIRAVRNGQTVAVGNRRLMEKMGVTPFEDHGTAVHIAVDDAYHGMICVEDTLRDTSHDAVRRLHAQGVEHIAIFSGDRTPAVDRVARALDIDHVHAELLPEMKIAEFDAFRERHPGRTVFVGDGINDAPVLRLADIGIAMGGLGSDAAIDAADAVIMTDDPERVPDAIDIARRTMFLVRENVVLILGVKAILMVLAALGLTTLWVAVLADTGMMILAVLNAMRAALDRR
ncbi:MAG: heavy metal translocating P-type ATPase [Saccharofermentanales bacterium]|jgi:Cd2+/Zn2+-exporting ATPase